MCLPPMLLQIWPWCTDPLSIVASHSPALMATTIMPFVYHYILPLILHLDGLLTWQTHQNNINHQQAIEFEQKNYKLSYTRGDVGPKPWGNANYCMCSLLYHCMRFQSSCRLGLFVGVPVYAKSTDLVPALIMWFFDSRSFVSGTGNGPGTSCSILSMASKWSAYTSYACRTGPCQCRLLLGR
jgi:hypothetical protein